MKSGSVPGSSVSLYPRERHSILAESGTPAGGREGPPPGSPVPSWKDLSGPEGKITIGYARSLL
jgi:hypothetical protein